MKKLQQIKLINWYTFQNETIKINGNILVSGSNGSGKSTLLDAIQYVLSAGRQKFNQAADETSKRTLETYIRCKLNLESKEYLRNDDVTSYIALEFINDDMKRKDIIGAVIEVTNASKPTRSFFKISNVDLADSLFIESNAPKTLWEFKHNQDINIDFFETKGEIQKMICSVLGLSGEKYFDLLSRALAFKPINDLNDFVNKFLLTEDNVSIENLKQNVEELRELLEIIELEENKVKALSDIENLYTFYTSQKLEFEKSNWLKSSIEQEKIKQKISNLEKQNKNLTIRIEQLTNIRKEYIAKKNNLEELEKQYRTTIDSNKEASLYYDLNNKLNKLLLEKENLKPLFNSYKKNINKLKINLSGFTWSKTLNNIDLSNISDLKEVLSNLNETALKEKHNLGLYKNDLEKKRQEIKNNLQKLTSKIAKLKMKKLPYEENIINLQTEIKNYLSNKYKENIEVRPLCEYLEITTEKWRNAIEGYLNNQRFDLIIEPKYFDEALELYEKKKKEKNIYGVGLVNTKKIKDCDATLNTLATHITSNNIYAKRYATYLLNKVACCEKIEELKLHKQAITITCMTYRNYVARQINPKVYEYYFIGQYATKQQIEKYSQMYDLAQETSKEIISKYNVVSSQYEKLNNSNIINLIQELTIVEKYNNLDKECLELQKNINNLEIKGLLNNIKEQIEQFEQEQKQLKELINNISDEISEIEVEIRHNQQLMEDNLENIFLPRSNSLDVDNEWNDELNKIITENKLDHQGKILENKLIKINNELNKINTDICLLLNNYNNNYEFLEIPALENISSYMQELSKIREQDLIKHKSNVSQFKEQCQISFREDFISKLKDRIETSKEQIKDLNKSLKTQKFGKEKYEFICQKSDNSEMGKYYDIIVSGKNYNKHNLFEENLSFEEQDCMDELFQKITASHSKDNANKVLNEYTDYRKYMSYDIKVTNEEGEVYYFSNSAKEKSGGEIQTPFYVIIASSFEQLLRNSRRTDSIGCLVIFDEAFNNMDESRIEAMMKFYTSLNIQLLIAVPPERIANIAPYVNTTLIISRTKNTSHISQFIIEDNQINE